VEGGRRDFRWYDWEREKVKIEWEGGSKVVGSGRRKWRLSRRRK
jgi:hypothetical protein